MGIRSSIPGNVVDFYLFDSAETFFELIHPVSHPMSVNGYIPRNKATGA
jgi:hypothetical protein